MSIYDEETVNKGHLIGYDSYTKDEIFENDDYVSYKGKLYLRANFLQSQLDIDGTFIIEDEE